MKAMFANGARGAMIMTAFSLGFTALMAGSYWLTADTVRKNEDATRTQLIAQTLPAGSYDNNLLADARPLTLDQSRQLGNDAVTSAYLAKQGGKTVAAVLEAVAPDGYAGKIKLLVAIASDGRTLGVRIVSHHETPGLGDYIDSAKTNWIFQFNGKSLSTPPVERWKVKKDGGAFDSNAGATISPRAVVKAVKNTLEFVQANPALLQ